MICVNNITKNILLSNYCQQYWVLYPRDPKTRMTRSIANSGHLAFVILINLINIRFTTNGIKIIHSNGKPILIHLSLQESYIGQKEPINTLRT